MPTVCIPSLMRDLTGGAERVRVEGATLRRVLAALDARHPGIGARLYDEGGDRIRPGIAVMIDGRIARMGLLEPVAETSEIHFLPAISGGV